MLFYSNSILFCSILFYSIYSFYLFILSIYLSFYLPIYRSIYLSLSLCLFVCLSIYLSICNLHFSKLTASKTQQFCVTYSFVKVDNIKNKALLRDFLIFRSWQHQKRNNSARLLHYLNWTTSKTEQFCETSSNFELDNIKNKAILRDGLQKWKVECRANSFVPMRFAIFPVHLSKVLRLPRKSDAKSYEVLHLSRKIISANLKIWCSII